MTKVSPSEQYSSNPTNQKHIDKGCCNSCFGEYSVPVRVAQVATAVAGGLAAVSSAENLGSEPAAAITAVVAGLYHTGGAAHSFCHGKKITKAAFLTAAAVCEIGLGVISGIKYIENHTGDYGDHTVVNGSATGNSSINGG